MSGPLRELEPHDPHDAGPYRLVGKLGAGGMGQVYLATGPGGPVAVKLVHDWLADDERFRDRFAREVAAGRIVDSPWTARIIDADTDAPSPWLAIEYIRGVPLDRAVATAGPLPAVSVHVLAIDAARALAAIHAAGLVHRDVKPANILLAADRPVLIDFGIARALDGTRVTTTGVAIGTPAFMSPEQAQGLDLGFSSDVFSLGSVLVHAASGQGPFGEGPPLAVLRRIRSDEPDLGALDDPLRALVERCLRRDPAGRPSAAELVAALEPAPPIPREGWLPPAVTAMLPDPPVVDPAVVGPAPPTPSPSAEPVAIFTGPPLARAPRQVSRRGLLIGLGAAAVVGGGIGIGLAVSGGGESPPPAGPRWTFPAGGTRGLVPGDGVVYVSGDSAQVHALDIATGQPRWTFTTRAGTRLPVAVTDGVVAAGGGAAYGLAAADGRRLWEAEDTEVLAAGSGVVIGWTREPGSRSDVVVGLDATTGSRSWTHPLPESAQPSDLRVAVDAGTAYLGTGTTLVALDVRSGAARWQYADDTRINHLGHVGDVVFCVPDIGAATRDVVGLDAASGAPRWQTASEWGVQGVGVDTENLYLHCVGSLQSWSAGGDSRWTTAPGLGGDPWPVFDPSTLAVTDYGCYVAGTYGLYDDTGRAMPIRDASSYGGYDAEFALFAFSPSSGRPRWRLPIEGTTELIAPARPLAAVPGTVFVSTPDAVHAVPEA